MVYFIREEKKFIFFEDSYSNVQYGVCDYYIFDNKNENVDLPYFAWILITSIAVYPAIKAIKSPIKIEEIRPDCLMAHGTDSNDVPIIVFHMAKLFQITWKWSNSK